VKYKHVCDLVDTIDKASIMEKYMVEFLEGATSITPVSRYGWTCFDASHIATVYLEKLNELKKVGEYNSTKTSQRWYLKRFFIALGIMIMKSDLMESNALLVKEKIIEIYELSEYIEANKNEV
tara:strand:- start:6443 stop:6811 length:369 start_codon:yes stop_codon:yes gene_type:complete